MPLDAKKRSRSVTPAGRVPREYDPERTRQAIIDAALDLFQRLGFHATSVQDITEAAGVTKGAFYHHFPSKEDLLLLIHDDYIDYQLKAVRAELGKPGTARERLSGLIRCVLEGVEQYHANVVIFFQERRYLTGDRFTHIRDRRDELEGEFRSLIQRGIRSGEFRRDLDGPVTCLGIIGMCAWTYQWFSPKGRLPIHSIAKQFTAMVLDGITAPPGLAGRGAGREKS
jgi:AcrR family transcriptional regulator